MVKVGVEGLRDRRHVGGPVIEHREVARALVVGGGQVQGHDRCHAHVDHDRLLMGEREVSGRPGHSYAVRGQVAVGRVVERAPGTVLAIVEQDRHVHASGGRGRQSMLDPFVGQLIHRYLDVVLGAVDQRDEWLIASTGLGDQRQPADGARVLCRRAGGDPWSIRAVVGMVLLAGVRVAGVCRVGSGYGATADGE